MRFSVLIATASAFSFRDMFNSSPIKMPRINGNEVIDLFPSLWTNRLERAINEINELDDNEMPKGLATASTFIQDTMDDLED